jgi:hypothetical protein
MNNLEWIIEWIVEIQKAYWKLFYESLIYGSPMDVEDKKRHANTRPYVFKKESE